MPDKTGISILVPKGTKQAIKDFADMQNKSVKDLFLYAFEVKYGTCDCKNTDK